MHKITPDATPFMLGDLVDDDSRVVEEEAPRIKGNGVGTAKSDPLPLFTRCALDVEAKPVSWLWPGRLPYGKLVVMAGEPGLGKSRLMASIAGIVSTGGYWPVAEGRCEPGEVLIASFEDDHEDTTVPRLQAECADISRIHFFVAVPDEKGKRSLDLNRDIDRIEEHLKRNPGIKLLGIDPISAVMGGIDSHKNAEVRAVLHPLADVARRHGICVLAITHLNKSGNGKALNRIIGSIAFTAAARVAYAVAKDESDPDDKRHLFLPIKNNVGRDEKGLAFQTDEVELPSGIVAPIIKWTGTVTTTADEALQPEEHKGAATEARDFLQTILADGPIPAEKVKAEAVRCGISERTLWRAKASLNVRAYRSTGTGINGRWHWELPK